MTINQRLAIGFGSIILMMLILTGISIHRVNYINNSITQMTDINSVKQRYAINFRGSVHDRAIAIRDVVFSRNAEELNTSINEINTLDSYYQESAKLLTPEKMTMTRAEIDIYEHIKSIEEKTIPLIDQVIKERQAGNLEAAAFILLNDAKPAFIEWLATLNEFIDLEETNNQVLTAKVRVVTSTFAGWMFSIAGVAIVIAVTLGYVISKRIRMSVGGEPKEAAEVIAKIAQGDLTGKVNSMCDNSMMASVQIMQEKLENIVHSIIQSSDELSQSSSIVASGSKQALSAAETQVTYTTTAVDRLTEMSSSINSVADTVHQTESNSKQTAELSLKGRSAVQKVASEIEKISLTVKATVTQVNNLQERTSEIGDIVNVIYSISDQTNLLALNAAIEAARAGEYGRGFAVVADEVRQLAKRTGEATGDIEKMIQQVQEGTQASVKAMEATVPQVENGLMLTNEANQLLSDIQTHANDSLEKVLEVVQATSEQVATVDEITTSVKEVAIMAKDSRQALQGNSEEAASLEQLSHKLKQDINYFVVKA